MDSKRKGICTNYDNCKNADNKVTVKVELSEDFICPECEQDLVAVETKSINFPVKKVLIIAIPVIVLSFLVWGGFALFSGRKAASENNKKVDIKPTVVNKVPVKNEIIKKAESPTTIATTSSPSPTSTNSIKTTPIKNQSVNTTTTAKPTQVNITSNEDKPKISKEIDYLAILNFSKEEFSCTIKDKKIAKKTYTTDSKGRKWNYQLQISTNREFSPESSIIDVIPLSLNSKFNVKQNKKVILRLYNNKYIDCVYFRYKIFTEGTEFFSNITAPLLVTCSNNECGIVNNGCK